MRRHASAALMLAALSLASGINATSGPFTARAEGATVRLSPSSSPRHHAPRGHDDIMPWARYCAATSRRRAARRGRRPGR